MRRGEGYLALAFVAVALFTVVLGALTWRVSDALREAVALVTRSHRVVRAVNRVHLMAAERETAARGFALTGEGRFLASGQAAARAIFRDLGTLRALTADEPSQRERLAQLVPLLAAKGDFESEVIATRRARGLAAAGALVATDEGRGLMLRIRGLLEDLREEEVRVLAARTAALAQFETRAVQSTLLLLCGAAASLAFGYWTVVRALRARQRVARRLDEARAAAQQTVDTVREPLVVLDAELRLVSANRAFHHRFATTPDTGRGRDFIALLPAEAAPSEELRRRLADVLTGDRAVDGLEIIAEFSEGGPRTLQLYARLVDSADSPRALLALEDVTDRLRVTELEVERRALERTNRELQEFAYVASHDLQEPLRKMRAFAERVTGTFARDLPADARDYLTRIASAAERMQRLIDDLLAFSRVTTRAVPFARVDLAAVARAVVSDLEPRLEANAGRVEIGPLPVVDGDPTQMRQLLQNLLVNAIKFRRPDVAPVVRVAGRVAPGPGGACELTVADNGIGFDEKYLDRIFTIFQRLHGRHEYEGTGLGLAICRKIVERHHGRITARSRPGEGATFVVTLPARQPSVQEAA